jgi:hypothetical protein
MEETKAILETDFDDEGSIFTDESSETTDESLELLEINKVEEKLYQIPIEESSVDSPEHKKQKFQGF